MAILGVAAQRPYNLAIPHKEMYNQN